MKLDNQYQIDIFAELKSSRCEPKALEKLVSQGVPTSIAKRNIAEVKRKIRASNRRTGYSKIVGGVTMSLAFYLYGSLFEEYFMAIIVLGGMAIFSGLYQLIFPHKYLLEE